MGPDSNSGPVVAYIDGQPVEIGHPLPEITPDYSAGGVTVEEATAAAERLAVAMGGIGMTIEVVAEGLRAFAHALEVAMAMNLAQIFEPELVRRYQHTKKKRTRKKYEKRILARFWEAWGKC